jgi:hypothetical protein
VLVWLDWPAPVCAEVAPGWVGRHDEFDLANAEPAFELLFPLDSRWDRRESFKVIELVDVVACRVTIRLDFVLVLTDACFELRSDADVKPLKSVGEYVNVGVFVHATPLLVPPHITVDGV